MSINNESTESTRTHESVSTEPIDGDILSELPSDDTDKIPGKDIILLEVLVKEAVQDNYRDVYWSILSNSLFLTGGIFYVIETTQDMKQGLSENVSNLYICAAIIGPLVYLANGLIDVMWAIRTRRKEQRQRDKLCNSEISAVRALSFAEGSSENPTTKTGEVEMTRAKKRFGNEFVTNAESLLRRLTRDVGHRREMRAAATFAVAALFDAMAAIFVYEDKDKHRAELMWDISVHAYLISAMFALFGGRNTSPGMSLTWVYVWWDADRLEDLGDYLFILGSFLDVVLNDMSFDDDEGWLPVFSAYLWLTDALLYLRGDYLVYCNIKREADLVLRGDSIDVESLSLSGNVIT